MAIPPGMLLQQTMDKTIFTQRILLPTDPPLVETPYGLRTYVRLPTLNNQGNKPMNFSKVRDATRRINDECAMQKCGESHAQHVVDAGLEELFRQTCDQFTAETKAMNVRLEDVKGFANARYDKTTAAAIRAETAANRATQAVDAAFASAERAVHAVNDARSYAKDAKEDSVEAQHFSEIAEEGANAVEEAQDDGDLLSRISAQAETIGEMQSVVEGQDAEIAAQAGVIVNLKGERDRATKHNRVMSASNFDLYGRAAKAEVKLVKVQASHTSALQQANKHIAERRAHEWDRANTAERDLSEARTTHQKTKDRLAATEAVRDNNARGWSAAADRSAGLSRELDGAREVREELESQLRNAKKENRHIVHLCFSRDILLRELHRILRDLPDHPAPAPGVWAATIEARDKLREWNRVGEKAPTPADLTV